MIRFPDLFCSNKFTWGAHVKEALLNHSIYHDLGNGYFQWVNILLIKKKSHLACIGSISAASCGGIPLGMYRVSQAALPLRINTLYGFYPVFMDVIQSILSRLAVPLGIIPQIISPQISAGNDPVIEKLGGRYKTWCLN